MIQDIAPHRMDNQYRPDAVPQENSPILIFTGSRTENVMAHVSEGHMRYPLYREMPEGITYTYLFSIDETGYFMGIVSKEAENLLPGETYRFTGKVMAEAGKKEKGEVILEEMGSQGD